MDDVENTMPLELPADLVPTDNSWEPSAIAGVITGGVLLALTLALTAIGTAYANGWIR